MPIEGEGIASVTEQTKNEIVRSSVCGNRKFRLYGTWRPIPHLLGGNVCLRETAMSDIEVAGLRASHPKHPRCPACGVPMWLVGVQNYVDGNQRRDRLHYECKACEAKAVLPSEYDAQLM
jgi:hypothetical protein